MTRLVGRFVCVILCAAISLTGCAQHDDEPVVSLPRPRDVLIAVGKRLADKLSAKEITDLAHHSDSLLRALTWRERSTLGRDLIRFRIEKPAIIDIAAAKGSEPFWLVDQGFERVPTTLSTKAGAFSIHRKSFPAGWVGLGVNGLDASSPAHYAVFVRPMKNAPALAVSELDPEIARIAVARDGIGPSFDDAQSFRQLPPEYVGALLLQTRHAARHASILVKDEAWKTHVPSSPSPDQVAIAFGADPAHELTFTWRTDPRISTPYLRIARAGRGGAGPADANAIRVLGGQSTIVESEGVVNDPIIRRHKVFATELEHDTNYVYSLGDGSPTGWTPWQVVRTGPDKPRDFSFLSMGDPQCGLEEWGKLLHQAWRKNPAASFLLIAGDLVDRGNERTNWDHFFLRAKGVFDELPLMPAIGNHEYLDGGPRLYRAFFEMPANGPEGIDRSLVYSFEYGDAVFAILDSNPKVAGLDGAKRQADWLDGVLSKTRATWKFVVFHHPIYTSHPTRTTPAHLRATWIPVFDKHHVDFVLQGHDHAYLRTHRMRRDRRVSDDESGTFYVVSVSGTKYCEQAPRDYIAKGAVNVSTYQTFQIHQKERRLIYRAVDLAGREIDYVVLEKPSVDDAPSDSNSYEDRPLRLAKDPRNGAKTPAR
jgi:acid phosphatase type 7